MPRKFIDVYDLQDHTNEMKTEIVPEIVKEVGGTGGSGTATNIADWAEKDSTVAIPTDKELSIPGSINASRFEGEDHADDTSVSLGSLLNQVYYLLQTEGSTNPAYPIDYSKIVKEADWESYVNAYPSLFSVDIANTSGETPTVVGIHTTIEKITDAIVKLMSSSGSNNTLPIIIRDSSSNAQAYTGIEGAENYSSFNTVNIFSDTLAGAAYKNEDAALASAFLDGIFSGSVPSYSSAYVGTNDFTAEGTSIHYVFKVTIDSVSDAGLFTCTAYYLDTNSDGALVVNKKTVYSKTTMPFIANRF